MKSNGLLREAVCRYSFLIGMVLRPGFSGASLKTAAMCRSERIGCRSINLGPEYAMISFGLRFKVFSEAVNSALFADGFFVAVRTAGKTLARIFEKRLTLFAEFRIRAVMRMTVNFGHQPNCPDLIGNIFILKLL